MLQLKYISKSYKTGDLIQKALDDVSLNFRDNEFVSILGPSGSGKSTLLNIVGGLDKYEQGDLLIDGISTKKYKDEDWDSYRNHTIGFVFQSYNLISHQTILANVELALTISGISKAEREKRAIDALDKVGLKNQIHKKPNQLSGGQMQRVAIARALVNNPSIVLADEPTGALDSETSVQVMELLKEVAKDRLVIMVTHNPKLANEYSTRIVELKDGKIISDSDPFLLEDDNNGIHKNFGKSSMSYLTSIALSFNNLKTKFKRTLMVAIAGSIGIIGIALILGLSNGVNQFIKDTEEETMISYPIEIDSSSFSMGKVLENSSEDNGGDISEVKTIQKMLSAINKNDLASLKEYFENDGKKVHDYSKTIEYKYDITPVIYAFNKDKYVKVNPNDALRTMGMPSGGFMFSRNSMKTFYKLPKNADLYKDKYTLKYGNWPSNENEAIVVTNSKGSLSDFIFYSLGLRDNDELSKMVKALANREKWDIEVENIAWKYEDIVGRELKVLSNSQLYSYDSRNKIYLDNSEDSEFVENLLKNKAKNLKIVGIATPNSDESSLILTTGIWYTDDLETSLRNISKESEVVKAQKEKPETNILTNTPFGEKIKQNLDFSKLFSIDQKKIFDAFKIDNSKMNFNANSMTNVDFSKYLSSVADSEYMKNLDIKLDSDKMISLIGDVLKGYFNYSSKDPTTNYSQLPNSITEYLRTDSVKNILSEFFSKIIAKSNGNLITSEKITDIMKSIMSGYPDFARRNNYNDPNKFNEYLLAYFQSSEAKSKVSAETTKLLKSLGENFKPDSKDLTELSNALSNGYIKYAKDNNKPDPSKIKESFNLYLSTTEAKSMISSGVKDLLNSSLSSNNSGSSQNFVDGIMKNISSAVANGIKDMLTGSMKNLQNAISIDPSKFSSAFSMNLNEDEIKSLISAMTNSNESSYENNMKLFGFVEDNDISKISIYPKNFEAKQSIIKLLDDYNEMRKKNSEEDKIITYTDLVGTILSSVTTIINVISYVLIAFVSISLIVSSIMIGVITYISVLERKKEIGILRSIGASKRNISQVFNAETGIIGLFAGLLGIGITYILLIPINIIIRKVSEMPNITAYLSIPQAIVLILISMILTLLGGFIPAKSAAKQNPVEALRTE